MLQIASTCTPDLKMNKLFLGNGATFKTFLDESSALFAKPLDQITSDAWHEAVQLMEPYRASWCPQTVRMSTICFLEWKY